MAKRPKPNDRERRLKLLPQLATMWQALLASPVRNSLLLLSGLLIGVVAATSFGQIRLNVWNQPFYDALSHRDLDGFLHQLIVFAIIAGALLGLNVAQKFLTETLKLKLREGLVKDLVEHWVRPLRAFRLANAGDIGVNPDQRVHEDARHLTELTADLGTGLLQAGILFVVFVGVLWRISAGFSFHFHGRDYLVPGYMVWAAVLYAGSASLLSYWAGRNLITRNAERYQRESELRVALVRVNEYSDAISLAAGEPDEVRHIEKDLGSVLAATWRLVLGLTNLTWITAGYGWFTLVAPIIAAAPLYFFGNLSFGGLMMAAGALHRSQSQITYEEGASDEYVISKLEIASPAGVTKVEEANVLIKPGARVVVVGEPAAGKTLLFRSLAGLWPWGSGTVRRPKGQSIYYMPRLAYWPPGTMREALAYPLDTDQLHDKTFRDALADLDLNGLAPDLDKSRDWREELNEDQWTRLAFVRLLIHEPSWILIDEVLDFVDSHCRALITAVLKKRLKGSAIIHIGRQLPNDDTFHTFVHLIHDTTVHKLPRRKRRPDARIVASVGLSG
jgi:putative ATP-binding cassette transporter